MIETKDITKMVRHILRRDKGIADTHIMHPNREWFAGLSVTTGIIVLGSWFCFYLFTVQVAKMSQEVTIVESVVPYQAATVKRALELFAIKQKTFEGIVGSNESIIEAQSSTSGTSTVLSTTTVSVVPDLVIDPPPVFTDEDVSGATLAP